MGSTIEEPVAYPRRIAFEMSAALPFLQGRVVVMSTEARRRESLAAQER
jgi:hypothetical protein